MKKLIVILIFLWTNSFADDFGDKINRLTDSLRTQNIDYIIVHRYSIFGGRINIPYDNAELQCDGRPTVAHLFWVKNNQWSCLRLDNCGLFEVIGIKAINIKRVNVDSQTEFKQGSAHFTQYNLTVIYGNDRDTVRLSGFQVREEKNKTTKAVKTINKVIERLENRTKFKRVK